VIILKNTYINFIAVALLLTIPVGTTHAILKGFSSSCLDAKMAGPDRAQMLIIDAPGKKPKENKKTYIFMCSGKKNICGASSTDGTDINLLLFGVSSQRIDEELGKAGIQKQGGVTSGKNPTTTNGNGTAFIDDPIVIAQYTKYGINHRFYWVQSAIDDGAIITPAPTLPEGQGLEVGDDGGLQLAQISFEDIVAPTSAPTSGTATGKNCSNIKWDPRGFIFDAETLNPVKNVTVTLFEKKSDKTYFQVQSGIGLTNPFTTATDSGHFNFFVNPGQYKMEIDPINSTIVEKNTINGAYQQLFADEKGQINIYEKGTDVEEVAGRVAVAHIPVHITDKSLIIDSLQLLMNDAVVNVNEETQKSQMHITGTVSHPKSKVTITRIMLDETGTIVIPPPKIISTTDLGEYDTYIDQEQTTAEGKPLFLQNINVQLELNSFYTRGVFSQSNHPDILGFFKNIWLTIQKRISIYAEGNISYNIKPVPLYVEGVAYDVNGTPIPKAIVGIYPFYSLNPMHVVIADENGRFRMGSQHVPELNYTLKYKKPDGDVIITEPEVFIKQNITLYTQEKIDPFASRELSVIEDKSMAVKVDKVVTEKDLQLLAKANSWSKNKGEGTQGLIKSEANLIQKQANPLLLIISICISIVALVGCSVFFGIKLYKRQFPTTD
jgi:hypothetical protein